MSNDKALGPIVSVSLSISPSEPASQKLLPHSQQRSPVLQDAMEKADVLIEAMGWIRQFRDKITVIKLGGSVLEDPEALRHLLVDVVFMESVGMRPIVVHGGGAAISRAMAEVNIEPRFIQGRRYTDGATLEIVQRVLAGEINESLASGSKSSAVGRCRSTLPEPPTTTCYSASD